jgi:enoyl-CoA hydratase
MISESVLVDVADRIATVTLNRPAARNALNRATQYALWDAIAAADGNPDVDVVILTGADPAFCAGIDLKEVAGEVPQSAPTRDARRDGPGDGEAGQAGAGHATPGQAGAGQAASRQAAFGHGGPGRDETGLYRFLPVTSKPVIGAINGPAVTGGLEVAQARGLNPGQGG